MGLLSTAVEFDENSYPVIWTKTGEIAGFVQPEDLRNVTPIGRSEFWFELKEQTFYFGSLDFKNIFDAFENLILYKNKF